MLAALALAGSVGAQGQVVWHGDSANGLPGDGILWTNPLNWSTDTLPLPTDDVLFGNGTVGTIRLNGSQSINSLSFDKAFTLGVYGSADVLTNASGLVTVLPNQLATIHSRYSSISGLSLSGGGTLLLTNPKNNLSTGPVTVEGTGTTLMVDLGGFRPQVNGTGGAQSNSRQNGPVLGAGTALRTINLQDGGEFKLIGGGANPDGTTFGFNFASGLGTLNVASAFQQVNLDDAGQLAGFGDMVKAGKGRLTLGGQDYNYSGNVIINGGILDLNRTVAVDDPTVTDPLVTITRFSSIAGTLQGNTTNTLTINGGGTLMLNAGAGQFDAANVIANDGAIIGVQGADLEMGLRINTGENKLTINGTVKILGRDLFTTQTQRLPRLHSDLLGSGTLELLPSTQAGSNSRLVIQRATAGSTFTGTFRLLENMSLEANPRFNATIDTGKLLAGGDVEFAGWGSTLDVRDSTATTSVFDYKANEVTVTSAQAGAVNIIAPIRGTAATGTGHLFNFGTLTMGSHRLAIGGNNSYQTGFADTSRITGNAVIEMRSDNSPLVFSNVAAISEDAAGRSLTVVKTGTGNSAARDVISGGTISLSALEVSTGTLQLRGASGAITTGFAGAPPTITINGGANNFTNGLPTQGLLNLDSNTGHAVGATTEIAPGNNNDRIVDSAVLNLRSNSILRLTSQTGAQTTETIGTTNVSGHAVLDVLKNGTAPAPVALTLTTLAMGANATANFTGGTTLGTAGADTARIVLPGTATGFMPSQFHSGNEWAKYDGTVDTGFQRGVSPFAATDYTINTTEDTWAVGQQIKQNGATLPVLTANRTADRFNFQTTPANASLDLASFVLTVAQGGVLTSNTTTGIVDGFTGTAPSGTAGITSSTPQLYVHNNAQFDIRTPVTGAIDFVKSGTATLRLIHHQLAVGGIAAAIPPFTDPSWTSTLTGNWIVNDGRFEVHRGQFLGGRPVVLNGGHFEINEPVSNANADSIIPGWGNNIVVNGNATVATDDNAESSDPSTGDRALVKLGSLTINNGSTLGISAFSEQDIAFMGGATLNGKATINTGIGRGNANQANIINGVLAGSGFDMVGYNGSAAVILGGTQSDTAPNTYNGALTVYAGTLRLNKANGVTAITDGAAAEDVVINGGALFWGPGQHGDLATTNSIGVANNGLLGIAATSPTAIRNAGRDQIADTATITLLAGTIGETDRFNNEKWGTLNQKNGTLNVGLGTLEVDVANVTGGAFNLNNSGTFKAGTLNLLPGAYNPSVTTGIGGDPTRMSTLEIGAGGLNMTGQNIIVGGGSNGSVAGAGAVVRLGGNVTSVYNPLLGNSATQGIFIQIGNSFRELGNSRIDLAGGNRTFTIGEDVQFFLTAPVINGGIVKDGLGTLILQPHQGSSFAGAITINSGVVAGRANNAFGTSAGGVTVGSGGTAKLEGSWTHGDNFTISGPGALIPGTTLVRELGALVSESGKSQIAGAVSLSADATIASHGVMNPSATPSAGAGFWTSDLTLENLAGVTGTGTLTLSGSGNGTIEGGLNTIAGGLDKIGIGRWIIKRAGSFTGATSVGAGRLRITHGGALGATTAGTTVFGGATLEVADGITVGEPLTLNGIGVEASSGALANLSGSNTYSGGITLQTDSTISSRSGNLVLSGGVASGQNRNLTLIGAGNGSVSGSISLGSGGVTKSGTGTWSFGGTNTYGGPTTIAGGTLLLDYTANNGSKLASSAPVFLNGGDLNVQGNAAANTVQAIGGLSLSTGGGTVQVTNGAGRTATLNVGGITQVVDPTTLRPMPGATVNFVVPSSGAISTSSTLTNGILGGYATVGQDWATKTGTDVGPFTAYQPLDPTGVAGATSNSRLSAPATLSSFVTTNSLKIDGSQELTMGFNGLVLSSGGLLLGGNAATSARITSAGGNISGATGDDELFIHTAAGTLEIAAPLVGFGSASVTKTGAGTLFVRNNGSTGYTGSVNVNGGTFTINGLGGTHPTALGAQSGNRNVNVNGATLRVIGGYDLNISGGQMQMVIGASGATIRQEFGGYYNDSDGGFWMNDAGQFSGTGDVTLTGGGRFRIDNNYSAFTGNVTVDASVLRVNNINSIGGRADQTITLKANSTLISEAGSNQQFAGVPNNLVLEGSASLVAQNGTRSFTGNVQLNGRNTIYLVDRDPLSTTGTQRDLHLMGRISGAGVTLDVIGGSVSNPLYLSDSSNDFTGTINLATNTTLEARQMGSLGQNAGDVTVNLNGTNSRLLLRHWQNADFNANVIVNDTAEINSDRLINFGGGSGQLLSINNLTVNGGQILQFGGGNSYVTQVKGTARFAASPVINATSNVLFENGMRFTGATNSLEKRGGGALILRGSADHTGNTLIQGGVIDLRGANGALAGTTKVEFRGGELRVENSEAVNTNRIASVTQLVLGGGTLRINGEQNTNFTNVTAPAGNTVVAYNPPSLTTVAAPLALGSAGTPFSRSLGATVQIQSQEDIGVAVGTTTLGASRVSPRIVLGGQTDVTGNAVLPGVFGNGNLDFVQYDGTTLDGGQPLGIREFRNAGTAGTPVYVNDEAEAGWTDTDVARIGTTTMRTLTLNRALEALKVEAAVTIALAAFNLRVENGILAVNNAVTISNTSGVLTAGVATPEATSPVAELFMGGNNTLTVSARVADNVGATSTQKVALVKTGSGTVAVSNTSNSFTGGVYLNSGQINVNNTGTLGAASNTITMAGGTLNMFAGSNNSGVDLGNFGQNVKVTSNNSVIILDNGSVPSGTLGTNNLYTMGSLAIEGPYTLGIRGFDAMDMNFTGATFTGTPTIDLPQAGSGSNPNSAPSIVQIGGVISGSGFYVNSSGNTDNSAATLRIGSGSADTASNTYTGKLITLFGSNNDDVFVELNKAPGTTAVPGDIEMNGAHVRLLADNQIADTSNIVVNQGIINFNGFADTVGSITMRGGKLGTGANAAAGGATIAGDAVVSGNSQFVDSNGFTVNTDGAITVQGLLKLSGFGRAVVGASNATLTLGGLEMTGSSLTQNSGAGLNIVRINGDIRSFESEVPALLGNSGDSDTFMEFNGTRTITVADGPAGEDLLLSTVLRDSTVGGSVGGIVKAGPGTMEIRGGGTPNSFSGPTTVNEGTLVLFKSTNSNSIGDGAVTVGDGLGGARADKLVLRRSNQIGDAAALTVSASGIVDMETFNTSERVSSLAGSGAITVGPSSTLTIAGTASSSFTGAITGSGGVTKEDTAILDLSGANDYVGPTTVNGGTLSVRGSIGGVTANFGSVVMTGFGPSALNVRGDFDLQVGATLNLELAGPVAGTGYDQFNVTGGITLAGDLQGSLLNGFKPSAANLFFVMVNDGIDAVTGEFNGLPEGSNVNFGGNNLLLTYKANFDSQSFVGGNDVALMIPEPSAALSLLAGLVPLLGLRRFRRQQS
ncbi:MAG: hypothetical protein JWQ44_1319 [Chthoniobacter sp.]|nr:hypothetical protein [Chthoniobacter sp.]